MKLALITGASSGIGWSLAEKLSNEGINLILCGRDIERLNQLQSGLKVSCQILVADLAHKEGRELVADVIRRHKPDLVVNNAGAGIYGAAVDLPVEQQTALVELNVCSLQELTLVAGKVMKEAGIKGTIVNISSTACFQVMPYFAVYSATKAYVTQFSQCLDFELSPFGIRVLTNCPGMVETRFRENAGGPVEKEKSFMVMTPEFAADEIWRQIQSGKRVLSFDWRYRVLTFLSRYIVPTSISAKISKKMIHEIVTKK